MTRPRAAGWLANVRALALMLGVGCCRWGGGPSAAVGQPVGVGDGQLVVVVQSGASPLADRFARQTLPRLRQLADEASVPLVVHDVAEVGQTPRGVEITPLIVFQNHRGRSIYQGRYETLDRVNNFIRTARYLPQGDDPLVREGLPVWEVGGGAGGAIIAAPIKITETRTAGGGAVRFSGELQNEIERAIGEAEARFVWRERVELGRDDRLFYVDFYPYLDTAGQAEDATSMYLGMALFSQFHCHEPIWTLDGGELRGTWGEAPQLFAEGFRRAAAEVARQLAESELGDGFDVVPAGVTRVEWEAAGLPLPAAPADADPAATADAELAEAWVIDQDVQADRPAVQFAFAAPLDGYAGEVLDVDGELMLGQGLTLAGMQIEVRADPATVTMGEVDLDAAIHGSMLEVEQHPEARFVVESVASEFERPAFGQVAAATLHGAFSMKGHTIPLSVPVSLEAILGSDGRPRLMLDGRWEVRLLEPFGIDGPPGEPPVNDTLIYRCHLVFEPAD